MIAHIVLFEPKPTMSATDRRTFVEALGRTLRQIPAVRRARVGRAVAPATGGEAATPPYRYAAILEFDSRGDLDRYLEAPAHKGLATAFWTACALTVILDVELFDGLTPAINGLLDS